MVIIISTATTTAAIAARRAREKRLRQMGFDKVLLRVTASKDEVGRAIAGGSNGKYRYQNGVLVYDGDGWFGRTKPTVSQWVNFAQEQGYIAVTIDRYDESGNRNLPEETIQKMYDAVKPLGVIRAVGLNIQGTPDKDA